MVRISDDGQDQEAPLSIESKSIIYSSQESISHHLHVGKPLVSSLDFMVKRPLIDDHFLRLAHCLPLELFLIFYLLPNLVVTVFVSVLSHLLTGQGLKESWSMETTFWHALIRSVFSLTVIPQSSLFPSLNRLLLSFTNTDFVFRNHTLFKRETVKYDSMLLDQVLDQIPDSHLLDIPNNCKMDPVSIRGEWILYKDLNPSILKQETDYGTVILHIHGGGHMSLSSTTHRTINSQLSRVLKAPVFCPNYRLAPDHPFPSGLVDILACYLSLKSGMPYNLANVVNLETVQRRWKNIVLVGDSGGAAMCLQLIQILKKLELPLPNCVILLSPFLDHEFKAPSHFENRSSCIMNIDIPGSRWMMHKYGTVFLT